MEDKTVTIVGDKWDVHMAGVFIYQEYNGKDKEAGDATNAEE